MSDLYGCHFAVTTKKTGLAGLNRTGGFVCALSVFVTCSFRPYGKWGQRTAGTWQSIFDLSRWRRFKAKSREISGRFLSWTIRGVHVAPGLAGSTTRLSTGTKSQLSDSYSTEKQEHRKTGHKNMTHTLMYVFLPLLKHGRGEWGLWKLWGAATDVSLIIDCEIWHSLAEFHHISKHFCNRCWV